MPPREKPFRTLKRSRMGIFAPQCAPIRRERLEFLRGPDYPAMHNASQLREACGRDRNTAAPCVLRKSAALLLPGRLPAGSYALRGLPPPSLSRCRPEIRSPRALQFPAMLRNDMQSPACLPPWPPSRPGNWSQAPVSDAEGISRAPEVLSFVRAEGVQGMRAARAAAQSFR